MTDGPRITPQTVKVLRALLSDTTKGHWGLEVCELTKLASGTVYPIIARLERAGWVESHWEDPEAHVAEGRPRRRYYQLTPHGAMRAHNAVGNSNVKREAHPVASSVSNPVVGGGGR